MDFLPVIFSILKIIIVIIMIIISFKLFIINKKIKNIDLNFEKELKEKGKIYYLNNNGYSKKRN